MYKIVMVFFLLAVTLLTSFSVEARRYRYNDERRQPFSSSVEAAGTKQIVVDPNLHAWAAYDETGQLVRWGRASLGKNYCPDLRRGCRTVTGTYSIYRKQGAGCISHKFPLETNGGAKTPYCMHFYKGYALHGSHDVPNRNASHGCIRVTVADARWINKEFAEIGTKITVKPYNTPNNRKNYRKYSDAEYNNDDNYYGMMNTHPNYQMISQSDNEERYYDASNNTEIVYVYDDNNSDGSYSGNM